MTAEDTSAFLEQMWEKFAHLAQARVAALEDYVTAAKDGTASEEQRAAAESAAHKLVGALGSYQRPGSDEAARAEQVLRGSLALDELEPLVQRLRSIVG